MSRTLSRDSKTMRELSTTSSKWASAVDYVCAGFQRNSTGGSWCWVEGRRREDVWWGKRRTGRLSVCRGALFIEKRCSSDVLYCSFNSRWETTVEKLAERFVCVKRSEIERGGKKKRETE